MKQRIRDKTIPRAGDITELRLLELSHQIVVLWARLQRRESDATRIGF